MIIIIDWSEYNNITTKSQRKSPQGFCDITQWACGQPAAAATEYSNDPLNGHQPQHNEWNAIS